MADALELHEGEVVEKEFKSDYWEKTLCFYSQKRGKYWFTNQRIVFRGGFATILEIPYADIESVQLCNVGGLVQIIPTGIKVTLKSCLLYTSPPRADEPGTDSTVLWV